MKLSSAGRATTLRALGTCIRWWRMSVQLAVTAVVIAVMSHNAANPYPVQPADGVPVAPHVRSLP